MTELVKESLKDLRGYTSSTRLKSWYILWFTIFFLPFYLLIMILGLKFLGVTGDAASSYLFVMSALLITILGLLLTAAFYPAQLNKKTETNEIVELAKALKKDPLKDE